MSRSDPRTRRGAHRTGRQVTAALLPSLLAILAVTSLITALYVWRGEDSEPDKASAATSAISSEQSKTPTVSTSSAPAPSATTSSSAASESATPLPDVAVVVLNQTTRHGLAAKVADRLRSKGWTVRAVGNFRGVVPATTVYYPAGQQQAAQAAAEALPTPARTRPTFGNLSTTRLTVVVTDNYPG